MSFIKGSTSIDLGDTPVENIFIDIYMPMANGTFVQVYLLGYKYALNHEPNMSVNNASISRHLNIPLSDVLAAWDFWEDKNIIIKHESEDGDEDNYSVEFVNLKQLYIDNNYKPVYSAPQENSIEQEQPNSHALSPTDLVEANKVPEIRDMFVEINKIIARELVPNEKLKIIESLYKYNLDPSLVTEAFSYSKKQKNVRHLLSFSLGVVRTWYDQGILTVEDLQQYLIEQGDRYGFYGRVYKALGFPSQPSEAAIEIMNTWIDEFNFDIDVVLEACKNSTRTSNPNINYINAILKDWHDKGIKKVEDTEKLDTKPKSDTKYGKTRTTSKIRTKFHLAKSRGDKYTAKELEQLVLENQKKRLNN
ncbi:MAG TPA: DnaD domain protein [Clostridia bacterium]|nr:DnaD domain protein [Clostridia bacterium]